MTTTASNPVNYADAGLVPAPEQEPVYLGIRLGTWLKAATVTGLFALLFWPNLRRLWDKTNPFTGEPNWGHAIAVPLIGLYYLYVNREQLRAARTKPAWGGLPIALFGILFFAYGIYPGQNDWFKDIGMVIALFGVVTLLCGWEVMRIAWFPIVFLFCALPWPGLLYSRVAGPLQQLAAGVAVHVLQWCNVEAGRFGTKIFIIGNNNSLRTLNVAEACAGLRSLMTFVTVAGAVAFLSRRAMWQKIILVASAVPIAIFCNVMRVSGQGLLDRYVSPQLSESFAHQFVGMIMLIPAFFLILLVGWILQNLFIEEIDDKAALKNKGSGFGVQGSVGKEPEARRKPETTDAVGSALADGVASLGTKSSQPRTTPTQPTTRIPPRPTMILPPRPSGLAGGNRATPRGSAPLQQPPKPEPRTLNPEPSADPEPRKPEAR